MNEQITMAVLQKECLQVGFPYSECHFKCPIRGEDIVNPFLNWVTVPSDVFPFLRWTLSRQRVCTVLD